MKKLLLTAFAAAALFSTNAQYVLTQSTAPKVNDIYYQVYDDSVVTVSKGEAGQNKIWDLTNMDLAFDNTQTYSDATTSPYASDFPEADLMVEGQNAFFDVTANYFNWVGLLVDLGNGPQPVRLSNPESIARFPSTYGTTFKDTSAFSFSFFIGQEFNGLTIDSGRVSYNQTKIVSFDGSGTVLTQAGEFTNSIRERNEAITKQSFEACVVFVPATPCQWVDAGTIDPAYAGVPDTSVTYTWYNAKSTSPIADITYNYAEDTARSASFNLDPSFGSGISTVNKLNSSIYPNPANSSIYIKNVTDVKSVTITDLQGRVVKSINNPSSKIDVADLIAGHYFVSIQTTNNTITQSLQIVR